MSDEPNVNTGGGDHNMIEVIPHRHYIKVHTGQTRRRKQSRGFFSSAKAKLGLGGDGDDNEFWIGEPTDDLRGNILIICNWKWAKARRHGRSHIREQIQAVRSMEVLLQNAKILAKGFEARDGLTQAQIDEQWIRAGRLICEQVGDFDGGRAIQDMGSGQR
ncbi:hypothetical protein PpBr36_00163 [Pyricularia pennisetigena]|uniref:hypothetical protein n=1 Tax=Pyricularia pennisetigena TaxID=1578925 RepID=UPI0011515766|nr:hypothetical protein PpBr36_00163 [Pyricularia pennisetigena]TLS29396.1 hypothetical protein PpBr36_00163 [Pyricularia pennisetigena]